MADAHIASEPGLSARDGHGRQPTFVLTLILKQRITKMKTLLVSLAALVAVSGAALAAGGDDLRSSDTYFGKFSTKHKMESYATDSNALAVKAGKKKLTAFERMNLLQGEDRGGKARQSRTSAP
jgi:hypothetical protein